MRVLLVIGLLGGGGAERQVALFCERAKHLVDLGAFIVNPGDVWDPIVRSHLARVYDGGGSHAHKLATFAKVVRQDRPDVIHCWHTPPIVYPALTWPLHRRPIVVNVFDALSRSTDTAERRPMPIARLLPFVGATVANSQHLLGDLAEMGVIPRNASVIENGIVVPARAASHGAREDGSVRLAGVGSLKPLKNWGQLLRVAKLLRDQGRRVDVTIFGEGPSRPELEAQAAAIGLDPKRVFPGFSMDASATLVDFDVLLHPSRSEGLPNAVLEALAAGIPAVASDLACYDTLRSQGDWLKVHPIDDDDACVAALTPWLDDAAARASAGAAGRRMIEASFGVDRMAERFVEVYRTVC